MTSVEDLLQPLSWVFLGLLGMCGSSLRLGRRGTAGCSAFLALILWTGGSTPLGRWLLSTLEQPYAAGSRTVPAADAVVMLGGTHDFSAFTVLPFNLGDAGDRPLAAVELVRQGRAPNLVLGGPGVEMGGRWICDGEMLAVWVRGWRLPVGRLTVLQPSRNTREEALQVAALARTNGWRRVIVVTSGYHLRRGEAAVRKAGVADVYGVSAEFSGAGCLGGAGQWRFLPDTERFRFVGRWVHEQLGWWYYRWKGWV